MTYNEIEAFLEVVRCGSLSRAAQSLFVSQSTLSGRIMSLESELGMTLLVRRRGMRNAELTEEGRDFIPIAEKWRRLWNDTRAVTTRRGVRMLRAASIYSINAYIMPSVYSRFYRENPDIKLSLLTSHSYEVYHMIESGEAEIGIISRTEFSTRVETRPIYSEDMCFICCSGSAYKGQVHPSHLDPDHELCLSWNREFDAWHDYWFGANTHPALTTDDASVMCGFVGVGEHWAIVPVSVADKLVRTGTVRTCRLLDPPEPRQLYLLFPANEPVTQEGRLLLRTMHEVLSQGGGRWLYDV